MTILPQKFDCCCKIALNWASTLCTTKSDLSKGMNCIPVCKGQWINKFTTQADDLAQWDNKSLPHTQLGFSPVVVDVGLKNLDWGIRQVQEEIQYQWAFLGSFAILTLLTDNITSTSSELLDKISLFSSKRLWQSFRKQKVRDATSNIFLGGLWKWDL